MTPDPRNPETNASIFLRLKETDTRQRQMAWDEFHARYAPVIAAFARHRGASPADVDDVVQDVMVGFFARSPAFVYDPARGRFRAYLRTCTCHVLRDHAERRARGAHASLDGIDPSAAEVQQVWDDVWEQQLLRRAIEQVRIEIGQTRTFRAFELYVMLDRPAAQVSQELGLHVDNVYRSREQVTRMLRERVAEMRVDE